MFLSKLVLLPFRYLNFHSAIWCNDMSCISHVPNIFWVIQSYLNHISHIFSHNQGWGAYKSTNYAYIFRTRHHSTTIGWSSRRLILVSQSHCGTPWRCVFSRVAFASPRQPCALGSAMQQCEQRAYQMPMLTHQLVLCIRSTTCMVGD